MKKIAFSMAPVLALLAASPAFAADLKNNDDVAHEIYVESAETEKTVTIEAHATLHDLCHNCYVEVVESGSALSVEEEENLTITDGQLSVE
ncbi:hypothetical protein [Emcibacter sp.]|uniref:hypothetical protein n=1 Tax=Emcibacter sp. TaxID=1979954 RepID=UPI002AA73DF6|nr:hypothetical protein [Emcibacter sp.]